MSGQDASTKGADPHRVALLAAGGTGGHIFPAQALAEALNRRGWRVHLATDARGGQLRDSFPAEAVHVLRSATIRSKSPLALVGTFWALAAGFAGAWPVLGRVRPAVAVGFGGYPTLPPIAAARVCRVPILLHEQNSVMGRANRALARLADAVALSFAATDHVPAGVMAKAHHTGVPVRGAVVEAAEVPYTRPEGSGPFRLLVFGGSQGARAFSELVPAALAALPAPLRDRLDLVQQARPEDLDAVRGAYRKQGIKAEVEPFFTDLPARIAAAHLIVSRSGASTVAEISTIGRPAILVPLPGAIDNDQLMNARALDAQGAARLMPQSELTPDVLAGELGALMGAPDRLAQIAAAAKRHGRRDGAEALADLAERLAMGKGMAGNMDKQENGA